MPGSPLSSLSCMYRYWIWFVKIKLRPTVNYVFSSFLLHDSQGLDHLIISCVNDWPEQACYCFVDKDKAMESDSRKRYCRMCRRGQSNIWIIVEVEGVNVSAKQKLNVRGSKWNYEKISCYFSRVILCILKSFLGYSRAYLLNNDTFIC